MQVRALLYCWMVMIMISCAYTRPDTASMPLPPTEAVGSQCDCGAKADRVAAAPTSAPDTVLSAGLLVYQQYNCGRCHAFRPAQSSATLAPPLDHMAIQAAERIASPGYTGHTTSAEGYIRESIAKPAVYYVPGTQASAEQMPAYPDMSRTELEALVQLLLQQ